MNEFLQTKLGEVLGFARIEKDTLEKGKKAYGEYFSEDQLAKLTEQAHTIESSLMGLAKQHNYLDDVEKDAKETFEKVSKMRDTYLEGKWDEADEVLEWTGFYTGAALVHWYLVHGASTSLGMSELETLSQKAIDDYTSFFSSDEKMLEKVGKKNAS